jgi:hypothetical protein
MELIVIMVAIAVGTFGLSFLVIGLLGEPKAILLGVSLLLITGGLVCWVVIALNTIPTVVATDMFDIETIQIDQTSIQVIAINPFQKVNITEKFRRIFPKNTKIKRTQYSTWQCGLYIQSAPREKYEAILD